MFNAFVILKKYSDKVLFAKSNLSATDLYDSGVAYNQITDRIDFSNEIGGRPGPSLTSINDANFLTRSSTPDRVNRKCSWKVLSS